MAYDLPNLAWLRAFEASARHLSFTGAAAELNMTQAAVSHQVRALERQLGFALFDRLARGLRLTDMGGAYLPSVERAFVELSGSTQHLFGSVRPRTVAVRAPVSLGALWLAPRLAAFAQNHPEIQLRLFSSVWSDSVIDEQVDIDIRFGEGKWRGHDAELLARSAARVIAPPGWAEGHDDAERLAALAQRPLIHVFGHEDLWPRALAGAGISADNLQIIRCDASITAIELVRAGVGAAIILTAFLGPAIADRAVETPIGHDLDLAGAHYLVRRKGEPTLRNEAQTFADWLKAQAGAAHPETGQTVPPAA